MIENYRSYKRAEPVYFSGEIFFPIGLLFAAACISYGLLYFFGLGLAIAFNVMIAWCGYFYFHYYGKSSSNLSLEFLAGVILVVAVLLFVDYGVYALVTYQKTERFNGLYFSVWLIILLGVPLVYYIHYFGSDYYKRKNLADTYFKASFGVYHDRELLTHIDTIAFINSSKKRISDIKLENNTCFYSDKELAEMETSSKYYNLQNLVFSGLIHIPFDADQFIMSWYSVVEDQYYKVNVPFPCEQVLIEEEKYPLNESRSLRGKKSLRMFLHLYQNGGFKLYHGEVVLLNYLNTTPAEITPEERNEKIKRNRSSHQYYSDEKHFSQLIERLRTSNGIQERYELQYKLMLWNMAFSGIDERNFIEITDASFENYRIERAAIDELALRHLPKKVTLVYRGSYLLPWLNLYIDFQKLNKVIEANTRNNEGNKVLFSLDFKKDSGEELVFEIITNEKKIIFTDWEIAIDERHKKEIDEQQLEKREDDTKRALLKEAWDFVFSKDYRSAQKNCDTLLAMDPDYGFAYFLEARLLWYTKGFEACYAKRDYFIAKTAHEPTALAHIYNSFGCILDLELRYEESLPYFEKAIEINPKEPTYVCNLSEMYYKLKDPVKALKVASRAKRLGYESAMLTEILANKGKIDLINH